MRNGSKKNHQLKWWSIRSITLADFFIALAIDFKSALIKHIISRLIKQ